MTTATTNDEWEGGEALQSAWFKFNEVGDTIKGTLISRRLDEQGQFGPQWIYELKKADGSVWNVGIGAKKTGTIKRINNCEMGTIIAIRFDELGEKKGTNAPGKYLAVKGFGMDEEWLSGGLASSDDNEAPPFMG